MTHLAYVVRHALRRPRIAALGAREFRSDLTASFVDELEQESYDSGRELAHMLTLRRHDPAR